MCGIAGYISLYQKDIKSNKNIINTMLDTTTHRGPDEKRYILGNKYAFGTNRLAIQSIKNGQQPIDDGKFIAGFNGEIFNYEALKQALKNKISIKSEIQLILILYKRFGPTFVTKLKGQFAIYIFDKTQNKLFLFRDRLGIRPIFYTIDKKNGEFIFSSECKAILKVSKNLHEISKKGFAQASMFWTTVGDQTAFEGINLLPSSNFLEIDNKLEININRYENIFKKEKKLTNKCNLFELLEDSVKSQIFGEVGFCSYLSGGIDSTIIAYLLKKITKQKIDTFSVTFENDEYDESSSQKKVSNYLNTNHHNLRIKNSDISNNFYKTIQATETFLFRTAPVPMFLLSKLVKENNHKVFFSGEGADEIFFGYDIFFETKIRKFWSRNKNSNFRFLLFKKLYDYLPQFKNSRYFSMIKEFYRTSLTVDNDIFYSHFIRWSNYEYMKNFFNFSDDKNLSQDHLLENFINSLPNDFINLNLMRRTQHIECATLLSNYLLSSQGDRVSLANSVEGRYPYLDEDLITATKRLNDEYLAPGIKSKKKLRETFKAFLPDEILNRKKFAFQAPEARSFFNEDNTPTPIAKEYLEGSKAIEFHKNGNLSDLYEKIKDPLSSKRLGFRENMAFILGISEYCLRKFKQEYKSIR